MEDKYVLIVRPLSDEWPETVCSDHNFQQIFNLEEVRETKDFFMAMANDEVLEYRIAKISFLD